MAALPFGCLYHPVCLEHLTDAFQEGACNVAISLAACLHTVSVEMPHVADVVPLLYVSTIVAAFTACLQCTCLGSLGCPHAAPTQGCCDMHI